MIIEGQQIEIKWNKSNRNWYEDKGYTFTKTNDTFFVSPKDLPSGSHKKIMIKCDICGVELLREYREYVKSHDEIFGDTCSKCGRRKFIKTCKNKYGGVGLQSPKIKEKAKETNQLKYNCDYPMQNKEVYKKVRVSQEEKYGGIGLASLITGDKITKQIIKNYGVTNPSQSQIIKEKKKKTIKEHYGVEYIFQDEERYKEILKKARSTIYKNGNIPISKYEEIIVKMLMDLYGEENCYPAYPLFPLVLDCLVIIGDIKIDVEYDGWYWHKNREIQDRQRNYKLLGLGYKVLTIKSLKEIPTKEQLSIAIDELVNTDKHYKEIILDIDV